MKKVNFSSILPHIIAVAVFLIITVFFFSPIFFKHQSLSQGDIQQWEGSSKELRDFREKTGEEGLWASTMFSGMPAYLVNVQWSNGIVSVLKQVLSVGLPHPVCNIFLAFLCYYIMLLAFGVRPYLAITGAIAFGLSSFLIIGLGAGHNARIGAIAFMPLVIAGIHLAFSNKKILGFGVTTLGFALHLRENHLQITYYLGIIVAVYGLVRLIEAIRKKTLPDFLKTAILLIPALLIAMGTFFGQFWAVTEYTAYSSRGKSDLVVPGKATNQNGLPRDYAFAYNYGILEPMTLLVPDFYGGSSMRAFVQDEKSESYKALSQSGDNKLANQLANYTVNYWGPQGGTAGPYYAGAVILFLFVAGILFADKKYIWWLVSISVLSIFLSWGDSFSTFNYFIFDYLPGYNKFRSVNFALIIIFLAMPLLGMLGLENLMNKDFDKTIKKKLVIAFSITGGLCLLLIVFAGMMSFLKEGESQLPAWFTKALVSDRKSLFRSDAFRSLIFILIAFASIYFQVWKKISPFAFAAFLAFITVIDLAVVDKRYFTADSFKRKSEGAAMNMTEADQEILKDKSYYRVFNLQGTMAEAHTSYYHYSIGGYHGAKIRRYQDLYDSCISKQQMQLINDAQAGKLNFKNYGALNMLNIKYIVFGESRDNIIPNTASNGSAWFVSNIVEAKNPNEELSKVCTIDTRTTAVIDASKFSIPTTKADSTSTITILDHQPNYLKYESQSTGDGLAVFSEIYYPKGWKATIDGKEVEILRADYALRALSIPAGKHTIEFRFQPDAYFIGNKITMASSWIMLLVVIGSIVWAGKNTKEQL
jgi:hypothetical protein